MQDVQDPTALPAHKHFRLVTYTEQSTPNIKQGTVLSGTPKLKSSSLLEHLAITPLLYFLKLILVMQVYRKLFILEEKKNLC